LNSLAFLLVTFLKHSTSCVLWESGEIQSRHSLPTNFQRAFPPFHLDPTCTYFVGTLSQGMISLHRRTLSAERRLLWSVHFLMVIAGSPENFADQTTKLMPMVTRALDVVLAQHLSEGEQTNFRRLFNRTIEVMNQNSILIPGPYSGPHSIVCRDVSRA
jgi:hypothetical protein